MGFSNLNLSFSLPMSIPKGIFKKYGRRRELGRGNLSVSLLGRLGYIKRGVVYIEIDSLYCCPMLGIVFTYQPRLSELN